MVYLTPFNVPKEEYEGLIARREYWDDGGDEWNWSSIEEKIVRLAQFVQQGGNLSKIINRYAKECGERYRGRIQYCVASYILKIMYDDLFVINADAPFVRRIKRLDKIELVKLLSSQLKSSVTKSSVLDSDYKEHENWIIKYNGKQSPDELLDKIESKYWKDYSTYDSRADIWWDGLHSLW
jgi:hypothetical protein